MIRGDSGRLTGQIQSPGAAGRFAANVARREVELSHDQIRLPATPVSAIRTPLPAISERVERFSRGSLKLDLHDQDPPQAQSGQTVLLVEDNDINMRVSFSQFGCHISYAVLTCDPQLLIALMNKLKLEFDCAVNGLEALEKYKVSPSRYFLVLMDMNMPVNSILFPNADLLH